MTDAPSTSPSAPAAAATPAAADLPTRLNLGCGPDHRPHCLNVDVLPDIGADLVFDLDRHPYPLPRHHFTYVYALDVVEHLADVRGFMEEIHELLAPGGEIEITTPHFSCANSYIDPTHRQHLSCFSFDYFTAGHRWNYYSRARFELVERQLAFPTSHFHSLVGRLANRRLETYERHWSWIVPAWFIRLKLRAV